MKKILMLLFVGLATIGCSKDDEATPAPAENHALKVYNYTTHAEIKDGDVVVINSVSNTADANALKFYFKNTSSASINVKTRFVSFTGTPDTSLMQYCVGEQCLTSITTDTNYPGNGEPTLTVPANGTLGSGVYKIQNTATPTAPATKVDYVFEAYQYDAGLNEVGNKVRFTYRYQ